MALQDLTPQLRTRLNRMERAVGWFVLLAVAMMVIGFAYTTSKTPPNAEAGFSRKLPTKRVSAAGRG